MFLLPKDGMKGKYYVCRTYKKRIKVCFYYLESKKHEDIHSWCIFKWKCQKTVERTSFERSKRETRYWRRFSTFASSYKTTVGVFKTEEQHQRLMEHFKPLKTNNKVCLVYLQSKLQQERYTWCIYLLKCLKSKEKTHLEANEQQTRCRLT